MTIASPLHANRRVLYQLIVQAIQLAFIRVGLAIVPTDWDIDSRTEGAIRELFERSDVISTLRKELYKGVGLTANVTEDARKMSCNRKLRLCVFTYPYPTNRSPNTMRSVQWTQSRLEFPDVNPEYDIVISGTATKVQAG